MDRELLVKIRVGENCFFSYEAFDCFKCALTLRCPFDWTASMASHTKDAYEMGAAAWGAITHKDQAKLR